MFQAMSRVKLDRSRLGEYLTAVYPDSPEPDKQLLAQRDRGSSEFFFDQGKGNRLAAVEGTLWAGLNGVTEWIDHRQTRQNANQRLNSAWFWQGVMPALPTAENSLNAMPTCSPPKWPRRCRKTPDSTQYKYDLIASLHARHRPGCCCYRLPDVCADQFRADDPARWQTHHGCRLGGRD
jgi:hypothetical protein